MASDQLRMLMYLSKGDEINVFTYSLYDDAWVKCLVDEETEKAVKLLNLNTQHWAYFPKAVLQPRPSSFRPEINFHENDFVIADWFKLNLYQERVLSNEN